MAAPAATIGGLALATLALHVRDPHGQGAWGVCPIAAPRLSCPRCGGLRAGHAPTEGDVLGAPSTTPPLVVVLPFLLAALGVGSVARWRGTAHGVPRAAVRPLLVAGVALLAVF